MDLKTDKRTRRENRRRDTLLRAMNPDKIPGSLDQQLSCEGQSPLARLHNHYLARSLEQGNDDQRTRITGLREMIIGYAKSNGQKTEKEWVDFYRKNDLPPCVREQLLELQIIQQRFSSKCDGPLYTLFRDMPEFLYDTLAQKLKITRFYIQKTSPEPLLIAPMEEEYSPAEPDDYFLG
ncbi:MAG: hypothetical protein V1743_05230 [Nanoarchaeota archaeon]